jgi:GTP-binding protein
VRAKPLVAIVGRTNVGKSSLFNRLAGRRVSVVHDTAGVTRDRVYAEAMFCDRPVTLVDTGGLAGGAEDHLFTKVRDQALAALSEADVIVLVVDAQEGPVSSDHEVAAVVRRAGKPVVFVANKAESPKVELESFIEMGFGPPIPVSAIHAIGHRDVIEAVLQALPPAHQVEEDTSDAIAVAIIGRPNAGKSSIVNALAGQERAIVSEAPGTTRDCLDILVERGGRRFLLVDTAGIGRRFKQASGLEYYTALRSLRAIERADVAVLIMDAAEGPTAQDARLAGEAEQMGRGLVLCAHKWDIVLQRAIGDENLSRGERNKRDRLMRQDFERLLRERFSFVHHAPVLFTSVMIPGSTDNILPMTARVGEHVRLRIQTARVNRIVQEAVARHNPPTRRGRPLNIFYATQVAVRPPTIVMFVNDPDLLDQSYERYLENFLRQRLFGPGVPVRLHFRRRQS